jgi:hypothetical protein
MLQAETSSIDGLGCIQTHSCQVGLHADARTRRLWVLAEPGEPTHATRAPERVIHYLAGRLASRPWPVKVVQCGLQKAVREISRRIRSLLADREKPVITTARTLR